MIDLFTFFSVDFVCFVMCRLELVKQPGRWAFREVAKAPVTRSGKKTGMYMYMMDSNLDQ